MIYQLKEIAACTGGAFFGQDVTIDHVTTDSRRTNTPSGALFIAIRGANRDGHDYIDTLYRKGVRGFITDSTIDMQRYPDAGFIQCPDSIEALQRFAAHHRKQFRGLVVGITGSNGKTVTKEWIAQLAPPALKLFRSPKSYNSQLGVPLSILMLEGDEAVAIIEAGISQPGEMERLEQIIRPDIGIITNIGDAHQENFRDSNEKAVEKLKLFAHTPTILYHTNDPVLQVKIADLYADRTLITVDPAQYDLRDIPFPDAASRENAAAALALYEVLDYDRQTIAQKLPLLQHVAMRLELKEGINDCKIINDSYNADINSLGIALEYLSSVAGQREKVVILSDIDQSGLPEHQLYEQVAERIRINGIGELIGIGEAISRCGEAFKCQKSFFRTTEHFLREVNRSHFAKKSILLKGGRRFQFERIGRILENKIHTTTLEVNLDHMLHNLNYFRGLLQEGTPVMAMVKASSYGHGTFEVANLLENQGVHMLAVAFADEGVTLREAGITLPIVVLNADSDSFELMIDYRLEPEIYSHSSLLSFTETVRRHGENHYPIHIKLDTGMHRLGFTGTDIDPLIETLHNTPELHISTLFTHLAGSDEACHDDFTRTQITLFSAWSNRLITAFPQHRILRHIDNSAGIERFPEAQFDMVRLGIGLYGISAVHQEQLRPVATLRSRIVQIKEIPVGDTIGYGRHGVATDHPIRTATIPIGYADGLNRRLSQGRWSLIVNGHKAPIIGNICMDTCMIDITGMDAQEGDSVTIFGEGATVCEMAARLNTIPYEIMTGISVRVKRIYTKE